MSILARLLKLVPRLLAVSGGLLVGPMVPAAHAAAAASATLANPPVTVFAASSLTNVLKSLGDDYTKITGRPVRFSFGSSATLARQIEAGAGADVYVSADQEWMDYLDQRKRLRPGSRQVLAGNRLILIAPSDSRVALKIAKGFLLAAALGEGRLAVADPASVPAGRYARQSLEFLGVWPAVDPRLVRADDVRHALNFVARGEAPLGIVYATDVRVEPGVRVVDVFPANSHPPIIYPLALTADAQPAAADFATFLLGPRGQAAFKAAGFVMADGASMPMPPAAQPR